MGNELCVFGLGVDKNQCVWFVLCLYGFGINKKDKNAT
jgi:hypothetical protein